MKKALVGILLLSFMLQGCGTLYEGFTVIRIKATKLEGNAGPFHHYKGEGVDAVIVRKMYLLSDNDQKDLETPTIDMTIDKTDSTFTIGDPKKKENNDVTE